MNIAKKLFLILFAYFGIIMLPSCVKDVVPAHDKVSVLDNVPTQDDVSVTGETPTKYEICAQKGMLEKHKHVTESLASFLRLRKKQRKTYLRQKYNVDDIPDSLGAKLALVLEHEVQAFDSNIGVHYDIIPMTSGEVYELRVRNELTGKIICAIDVKKNVLSSPYYIDPDRDGCMQCSVTGKYYVNKCLESVFVMDGNNILEGEQKDFSRGNRNVYKIRQLPSLRQRVSGPCGFYALANLLFMDENSEKMNNADCDYSFMVDRERFEGLYAQWRQEVINIRGHVPSSPAIAVSNFEIKKLIKRCVNQLHKDNVMISVLEINSLNDNYALMFNEGSVTDRIRDFRENGTPQYFIFSSSSHKKVKGIKLCWDNNMGRKACLGNHWLAMKIEWAGEPQKSPVIMTLADSGMIRTSTHAAMVHWYYQAFVHLEI